MTTKYRFSQQYKHSEFLQIEACFKTKATEDVVEVFLPAWRPGRYQLGNFSRFVRNLKVFDNAGKEIKTIKHTKDSWLVYLGEQDAFKVTYDFFTSEINGGSTYVDEDIWYLNFINCAVYTKDSINGACKVALDIDNAWKIATSLNITGSNLLAKSFFELVGSPVIAAKEIKHLVYKCENISFHLWFYGKIKLDNANQIIADFQKFTQEQLAMMGSFENDDYHFLYQITDEKSYHGVEHLSSTSIVLGPAANFTQENFYDDLLGISAHELFHYWNIIRVRPKEMFPYDFQKENYFTTGYIAEGVTTYYGDLFLVRSKVKNIEWYEKELNKLLKRHLENYGRHYSSLASSSTDLWVDGYSSETPNRRVSIYVKGALIALMLDLIIISETQGEKSLDDVIRGLWNNAYKKNRGYTAQDYLLLAEGLIGRSLDWYKDDYIDGVVPIEVYLTALIETFGYKLIPKENDDTMASIVGIKISKINDKRSITNIAPNSIGEKYFRLKDIIESVNDENFDNRTNKINLSNGLLDIRFLRKNELRHVKILIDQKKETYFKTYELSRLPNVTTIQEKLRKRWLGW